ncbi:hypothetical protein B0H16DRAFT_1475652 [Mycena metata]|uniref:Uncharacterized protein n=1 Tax=Mycena metata TaxID=1033252 RepID=A0AAD7HDG8_9AGAR|nr:hypothetical protein B0H16DRAFT_1475652 [Mycena metata]
MAAPRGRIPPRPLGCVKSDVPTVVHLNSVWGIMYFEHARGARVAVEIGGYSGFHQHELVYLLANTPLVLVQPFNVYCLAAISVVLRAMSPLPVLIHGEFNDGAGSVSPFIWATLQIALPNFVCTTKAASFVAPFKRMLSVIAVVHICSITVCVAPPACQVINAFFFNACEGAVPVRSFTKPGSSIVVVTHCIFSFLQPKYRTSLYNAESSLSSVHRKDTKELFLPLIWLLRCDQDATVIDSFLAPDSAWNSVHIESKTNNESKRTMFSPATFPSVDVSMNPTPRSLSLKLPFWRKCSQCFAVLVPNAQTFCAIMSPFRLTT